MALQDGGGLFRYLQGAGSFEPFLQGQGNVITIDLAADSVAGQDYVLVTSLGLTSGQFNSTYVIGYTDQGKEVARWMGRGQFTGVVIDTRNSLIYVGNKSSSEISVLKLSDPKSLPMTVVAIPSIGSLGPMAMDVAKQQIFVGDKLEGKLYTADLRTHKARLILSGLGEPAALAFDATKRKLYVADAAKRRISVLDLEAVTATPEARIFSAPREFREPRGLTIDASGAVWVADFGAKSVFVLSPSGQITRKLK